MAFAASALREVKNHNICTSCGFIIGELYVVIFYPVYYYAREECILQDIEPLELHSKMQYPSFVEEAQLIDVREPEEV